MSKGTCSMMCWVRSTTTLSLLLFLVCSHRSCQSFQPSPLLSTTRSSVFSLSTPKPSFRSNNRRYSSHAHFYADPTSSNIHDQTPPQPSFEQRMRQQLKRYQSKRTAPSQSNQLVPDIRNLQEYKEVLDKTGEDERILAVLWYSPWCKACRAVMPGIRTLAKRHPDIQFIQVPVLSENANLHQGLDVPSVPYMHLYVPEDPRLVEETKMTRKRLSGFQKLLCDYERGHCSLEQYDKNGDEVWSTSNPYSLASTRGKTSNTPETNFPEATSGGVGATAQ